jgi:transcription elongation factor GreA-like protein
MTIMKIEQIRKTIKETRKGLKELGQNLKDKEKKLEIELLNALKNTQTFARQDIFKLFPNQSEEELVKILRKMVRKKEIQSIGRDFYSIEKVRKKVTPSLSKDMEEIRILLN